MVSIDYFEYPYIYKLKVIHNFNGFGLPDISLCTDRRVLFDRSKIYQIFYPGHDLGDFFKNNSVDAVITKEDMDLPNVGLNKKESWYVRKEPGDYRLEPFFNSIQYNITNELNFNQINNLMIRSNQLFNCSGKIHFRYQ